MKWVEDFSKCKKSDVLQSVATAGDVLFLISTSTQIFFLLLHFTAIIQSNEAEPFTSSMHSKILNILIYCYSSRGSNFSVSVFHLSLNLVSFLLEYSGEINAKTNESVIV